MESFHERTQPLGSLEKVYAKLGDIDALWAAGEVPGWADRGQGTAGEDASSAIDVAAFASVEELETLGAAPLIPPLIGQCTLKACVALQGAAYVPSLGTLPDALSWTSCLSASWKITGFDIASFVAQDYREGRSSQAHSAGLLTMSLFILLGPSTY